MSTSTTTTTSTATAPINRAIRHRLHNNQQDESTIDVNRIDGVLNDYAIHTTGSAPDTAEQPLLSTTTSKPSTPGLSPQDMLEGRINPFTCPHPRVANVVSPDWWPRDWRRIPDYAPVNRDLEISERPLGGNPRIERMIFVVINGCALISTYAFVWRNTFGRINDRIFRYEVGGEY